MIKPLALATILALSACVAPAHEVIRDNPGGDILDFIKEREVMKRSGKQYVIRGYCGSACTMFLSLPNVCVHPDAQIGFHWPPSNAEGWKHFYTVNLPAAMAEWFLDGHDREPATWITGRQAIRLGANACS